jgi:homoserine dehydrogenase
VDNPQIVVLKLGSSVLPRKDSFPAVVSEIYRHVREGQRVVAVVSALEGQTNRLLSEAHAVNEAPDPNLLAELLGTGELQSALLLVLALERAGIPALHLGPAELGMVASGNPLDSDPVSIDAGRLRTALRENAVVVVPGFIAVDEAGRSVLLGRGGSDLTALFIARSLGNVPCRLIKDVDGVYERDPAIPGIVPRRFSEISWADALGVAGQLVQEKAIRFAQDHRLPFEIAALGTEGATRVERGPSRLLSQAAAPRPLRVALFGAGTVGYGVYRHLAAAPERFQVVGIAVRDLAKPRPADLPLELLTDDPWMLLEQPSDLVIEVLGGEDPALGLIARALESGRDVVTANKPVVADHGSLLEELAERHGRSFRYSASVGGSLPAVELATLAAARGDVVAVEGVLNGTCNFILDRLADGEQFDTALVEAQRRGFAEADPTQDISGADTASKLRILARAAFGEELSAAQVLRAGIDGIAAAEVAEASALGVATRLVASCRRSGERLTAEVAPTRLPGEAALAGVRAEWNEVRIELADGGEIVSRGKGAGRWPTAESVFADVMDAWREKTGTRASPSQEITPLQAPARAAAG